MSFVHGTPTGGVFRLYLTVNWEIVAFEKFYDEQLFNKKSEFISKCRHENKLLALKLAESG